MLSRAPAGGEALTSHCLAAPLLSLLLSVIRVCLGSRVALRLMHREKLSGAVARIDVEVCSPLCMGHRNHQHLDASRKGNHRHLRRRSCEALREGIAVDLAVKLFSPLVYRHIYIVSQPHHIRQHNARVGQRGAARHGTASLPQSFAHGTAAPRAQMLDDSNHVVHYVIMS